MAGRGPPGAAGSGKKRLAGIGTTVRCDVSDPTERVWAGRLPVRPDRRRPPVEAVEHRRRVHPRSLAMDVERNIDADHVIADARPARRGPRATRATCGSTTDPSSARTRVADWCRFSGVGVIFIDPGSPWQNAFVESFNGRSATSCSTVERVRLAPRSQGRDRGMAHRLQHPPAAPAPRHAHPSRVRAAWTINTNQHSHRTGPPTGAPSNGTAPHRNQ